MNSVLSAIATGDRIRTSPDDGMRMSFGVFQGSPGVEGRSSTPRAGVKPEGDGFAGIRFHTREGEPVAADRKGWSWMGFGGKDSGEVSHGFATGRTELILALESWTGSEEVAVEVDLKAGLTLPGPGR